MEFVQHLVALNCQFLLILLDHLQLLIDCLVSIGGIPFLEAIHEFSLFLLHLQVFEVLGQQVKVAHV